MRIAIVAGELSGDLLGAGLMSALKQRYPQAHFQGIGGEDMLKQGLAALFPIDRLAVMGLVEVLRHLPDLIWIRWTLYRQLVADPPDVFIGIDAPDFNLPLERCLRAKGIPTVHYVSPSVWAWRQKRVRKIARSVDLMLTLLPFEASFYRDHRVPVAWVGHPLADQIPLQNDQAAARRDLGLALDTPLLAILPGSRLGEVTTLGPLFVDTAHWLWRRRPDLRFMIPAATAPIRRLLESMLAKQAPDLPLMLVNARSREVMAAADVVLLASGTATLEALLLKRPMVVAYRIAPLSAWIAARLIKISYFSLPNLLAEQALVDEFIQEAATLENLGPALLALLDDTDAGERLQSEFNRIHTMLRRDANKRAAAAVARLLEDKACPPC